MNCFAIFHVTELLRADSLADAYVYDNCTCTWNPGVIQVSKKRIHMWKASRKYRRSFSCILYSYDGKFPVEFCSEDVPCMREKIETELIAKLRNQGVLDSYVLKLGYKTVESALKCLPSGLRTEDYLHDIVTYAHILLPTFWREVYV